MRFLQDSSSPSLETETLLGATFSKIFAWSQADVCESDHRLIVMIQDKAYELAV
jgi:phage-related minor tail protein